MSSRRPAVKTGTVTMGGKAFVDTNVLLRALLTDMDSHSASDALLKRMLHEEAELWINGQVIREFIVQATHPKTLKTPLTMAQVIDEINKIKPIFQMADETQAVRDKLLDLLAEHPTQGKHVHDVNLVATMLTNGIEVLLTINTDDFKNFANQIELISPQSEA